MRDSFLIQRYMYDALRMMNDADRLRCYDALFEYALNDVPIPDRLPESVLNIIKEKLDGNISSYDAYSSRVSGKYRRWRNAVLVQDGYKCKNCGSLENLEVHHIIPFSEGTDLRYDVNNGIVLCRDCHRRIHEKR